jgi:hypothetical protein
LAQYNKYLILNILELIKYSKRIPSVFYAEKWLQLIPISDSCKKYTDK